MLRPLKQAQLNSVLSVLAAHLEMLAGRQACSHSLFAAVLITDIAGLEREEELHRSCIGADELVAR